MRLVTYCPGPALPPRIGVRVGHRVLDIEAASRVDGQPLPNTMKALLREGRGALSRVQALAKAAATNAGRFSHAMVEERAVRFLPPVPDADRFPCMGRNYRSHVEQPASERIGEMPEEVSGFVNVNACLTGHNEKVARPAAGARLDSGPELVFVIGRHVLGFDKERDDAMDYVVGVTVLNDLADADMQKREAAPGSRPLGPEIVTMDEIPDPYDLWMTCSVNGEERMRVNTRDQVRKMPDILAHFSRTVALEPGDMFSTGAPGGKPDADALLLKPGDVVECSIEGVTTLRNTIAAA